MSRIALFSFMLAIPVAQANTQRPADAALNKAAELLSAWHTEDLPGAKVWAHHPGLGDSLLWLADNARLVGQRHRALSALRYFEAPQYRSRLLELAQDATQPALITGGALLGLQGQDLDAATCERLAPLQNDTIPPIRIPAELLQASPACTTPGK